MRNCSRLTGFLFGLVLAGAFGQAVHAAGTLTVVDESNRPVAGATVLLGYEEGNPFPGNVFTTGASGTAAVPGNWKSALPLTVQADGYIAVTIPAAAPGPQVIRLQQQEPQGNIEVKGTTTDFGRLIQDGKVDFGLVIPAINREQMLAFDVAGILSPQSDTISIIGKQIELPSNITLPQQTESYVLPITLNKPDYRMYVRKPGAYKLGVTHGQFPLQKVVDDIRGGKSFLEVVNHFDFKEGGQRDIDVSGDLSGIDLAVNQTPFDTSFAVKAPDYPAGLTMMSLSLMEINGVFLPTDMKRFAPGQNINLKAATKSSSTAALSILLENPSNDFRGAANSVLWHWFEPLLNIMPGAAPSKGVQDFNKMSFAFLPAAGGVEPQFLPLVERPALNGQVLSFSPPATTNGLTPVAMYVTLTELETIVNGKVKFERSTRLWEIWSDAWITQFELPKLAFARRSDRTYRWNVIFLARPAKFIGESFLQPRVDLRTITHATRNSVDI